MGDEHTVVKTVISVLNDEDFGAELSLVEDTSLISLVDATGSVFWIVEVEDWSSVSSLPVDAYDAVGNG